MTLVIVIGIICLLGLAFIDAKEKWNDDLPKSWEWWKKRIK